MFPAFRIIRRCLEREVDAGARHSEVVIRARDDVPAEVVGPADLRGDANFEPTAYLAYELSVAVLELATDGQIVRRIEEEVVIATATQTPPPPTQT